MTLLDGTYKSSINVWGSQGPGLILFKSLGVGKQGNLGPGCMVLENT